MSYPVYYIPDGDTLVHLFDTFDGGTGASITMSGFAVGDILIYKDGGTTQRSSTAGFTLLDTDGIDFDTLTGIHGFSLDLSDNTDTGFYSVGSWFHVVVSAITVDSQTVRFVACAFRIMAAEASAGVPDANVASIDNDAITAASIAANAITSSELADGAITAAKIATDAITAAKIAADAIGASELASDAVAEITGGVWNEDATGHQTAGTFGQAIGDPGANAETIYEAVVTDATGTNVAADVIAVKAETASIVADTNELQTDDVPGLIAALNDPTAASVADAVWDEAKSGHVGSGSFGEEVQAHALSTEISALNDLSAADVNAQVDAAFTTQMADSVPADGTIATREQALYMIKQFLFERVVTTTTVSVKKVDGSTELFSLTLDDASNPTSITRSG